MKGKKIAMYSDSFGWGHVTRDYALLKKWAENNINGIAYWRVPQEVIGICKNMCRDEKNIVVQQCEKGIGFAPKGLGVDIEASKPFLKEWRNRADIIAEDEAKFLGEENVELVLSDIRPEAFYAAKEAGVPSCAVSNFSWASVCSANWPEWDWLNTYLERGYSFAKKSFILPLNEPCRELPNKEKTPFLAREITNRHVGKSKNRQARIVLGKSIEKVANKIDVQGWDIYEGLPEDDIWGQNYYEGLDVVLAKASYGACSEAIQAEVPLIVCVRDGFEESKDIAKSVEENGWGWNIQYDEWGEALKNWGLLPALNAKEADFGGAKFITKKIEELT